MTICEACNCSVTSDRIFNICGDCFHGITRPKTQEISFGIMTKTDEEQLMLILARNGYKVWYDDVGDKNKAAWIYKPTVNVIIED